METLKRSWQRIPRIIRQVCVAIIGTLVTIAGIVLLPLPGPGWVIIFLGLAILATEFLWANRIKQWLTHKFKSAFEAIKNKRSKN